VAPRGPYFDKVAGLTMAPVTTGQIYWGAVPFVVIQLIMVGLAITFPQMVMHYKGTIEVDPSQIEIIVPDTGGGSDLPDFGNPATPVEPPAFD
jgi:hypothetical protein